MSAPAQGRALRVALLNPFFWPEVRRGAERIIRELADGLIERGHSARLITSHPGLPSRSVEDGLEVVRNWRPPEGRLRRRMFEQHLSHVPFSYLSLSAGDDDIAHATYPTDALAAVRWAERTGRPAVLTYMGIPDRPWLSERRSRIAITRRAMKGSAAVVMVSRFAAEACSRWLGIEPRVIHPGIDLETFRPGGERSSAPLIVCATSPAAVDEPRKRIGMLIAAFGRVRRERPDARLLLSRPQRENGDVMRAVREAEGVELLGSDELAPEYRRAWVSVLPSIGESFGIVLAEALACGTPVVGARSGAVPEVVDREQIGRLFERDDERGLAHALLEAFELAQDGSTAAACRARAEEFSSARATEQYVSLYRELTAQG